MRDTRWSTTLSLIVAAISSAVLVFGWVAGIDQFKRIRPDWAAMVPSTTVCYLLLSCGLIAMNTLRARVIPVGCALLAGVIALINIIIQSGTDRSGIDDFFSFALGPDDAMAFATAASVLLASYCLATLAQRSWIRPRWFEAAATVGLLASSVALVGYAFDTRALYEVFVFTAMAFHTALLFAMLFVALLLAEPRNTWVDILLRPEPGSAGARRLLPIVALLPIAFCYVALQLTEAGVFDANFRLSVLAIGMTTLVSAAVLRNGFLENRANRGRTELLRDLERTNRDRAMLLRELYHRVKNNLQQINAMLRIEARKIDDERLSASFRAIAQRINALGLVHQLLISSDSPSEVEVEGFLKELSEGLASSHGLDERQITLRVDADPGNAHIEVAISMGLLVNELVTNAIKHAFGEGGGGIKITYRVYADCLVLGVADDGTAALEETYIAEGSGTGSLLIRSMVSQLKAELSIETDNGTNIEVRMPADINEQDRYE